MTRILTITNMYPPHHYGGYELSCRDVMVRLVERGHEVTVLTSDIRVAGATDLAGEELVRRQLRMYWDDHVLLSPWLPGRIAVERRNQAALQQALDEVQPEVVSVWNMGALSLGLLATVADRGVPAVLAICDEWPVYGLRLDAWSRLWDGRRLLRRVASWLTGLPVGPPDVGRLGTACFVSRALQERVEERSPWHFPDATVVYSGIDRGDFPAVQLVPERPWRGRVLYVGRIDPRKGIGTLIEAVALLPEMTLEICGRGGAAEEAALRELIERLELSGRVDVAPVERAELPDRYAAADVFVFPSTWAEPFGLVPLEAMACGTPVVATGTGGSAEFLVDGANCLLVPPGDAPALTAAIERLRDDAVLRRRLAESALATAADLDTDRLTDVFERWHVAVATRFESGRPPDRPAPVVASGR